MNMNSTGAVAAEVTKQRIAEGNNNQGNIHSNAVTSSSIAAAFEIAFGSVSEEYDVTGRTDDVNFITKHLIELNDNKLVAAQEVISNQVASATNWLENCKVDKIMELRKLRLAEKKLKAQIQEIDAALNDRSISGYVEVLKMTDRISDQAADELLSWVKKNPGTTRTPRAKRNP
jgi:ribosomal protein L17